jgi:hypothetical protein
MRAPPLGAVVVVAAAAAAPSKKSAGVAVVAVVSPPQSPPAKRIQQLTMTCPRIVENKSCGAGTDMKKKKSVRAEKMRMADEFEI